MEIHVFVSLRDIRWGIYNMMKILFVIPSMRIGGAEKSLVNLLNLMDLNEYDVSLLLFKPEGDFCNKFHQAFIF